MGYSSAPPIIEIYDDSDTTGGHADDQPHISSEIAAFIPAQYPDLLIGPPKNYQAKHTLQMGKAPATALTRLQIGEESITFDPGRGITTFGTNPQNTTFLAGTKVGSGNRASGKLGSVIRGGSALTIQGNAGIYGSDLHSETGGINIGTGAGVTFVEIMNSILNAATVIQIGGGNAPTVPRLFNVDFISKTTVATVVTNFFAGFAERLTFTASNPVGFILWNASVTPRIKQAKFIGTPSTADVRITAVPALHLELIEPQYSEAAPRFPNSATLTTDPAAAMSPQEWWLYTARLFDPIDSQPEPGLTVRLRDTVTGAVMASGVSDADGLFTFGDSVNTIYGNAVVVFDYYRDVAKPNSYFWREHTFEVDVNYDNANKAFFPMTIPFRFPWSTGPYGPIARNVEGHPIVLVRTQRTGREEYRPALA